MRTKRIKVYSFNELSNEAKQVAISDYRNKDLCFDFIYDDARNTVEKFNDIFNIKTSNRNFLECEFYHLDDNVLELSGARLQKYIWNNYKDNLFKGKYYSVKSNNKIYHKRVKSEVLSNGKIFNAYYSSFKIDKCCVLTGMCYDDNMFKPIYEFLELRTFDDTTFEDLLKDCFYSLKKTLKNEEQYMYSEEYISEELESSEREFLSNGKPFNN